MVLVESKIHFGREVADEVGMVKGNKASRDVS